MSAEQLSERVFKHLERQARWLAEKLQELEALTRNPADEDLVLHHREIGRGLETLLEEQRLLLREWNGLEEVDPQLRGAVQQRAREVLELLLETNGKMQALQERLDQEAAQHVASLGALRVGREVLQGYTPAREEPGFDHKG